MKLSSIFQCKAMSLWSLLLLFDRVRVSRAEGSSSFGVGYKGICDSGKVDVGLATRAFDMNGFDDISRVCLKLNFL